MARPTNVFGQLRVPEPHCQTPNYWRLLGLAYFWVGSANGVQLQLWATWLLYAVLVDLTDAVADELAQPFAALSLEMVYRSLYFFTAAYHRGAARDVVPYLATEAVDLGIIKR